MNEPALETPEIDGRSDSRSLMPAWVTNDWQIAAVIGVVVIAGLFVFGSLYGMVLALIAEGGVEAILPGLLVGAYFAFSVVGAESSATSAFSTAGDGVEVSIGTRMMPIGLWVVFLYIVWRAFKYGGRRLSPGPWAAVGFVAKLALAISVPLGVIGSILTFDDTTSTGELTSKVSGGAVFLYSLLAVAGVGVFRLAQTRLLPVPSRFIERIEGAPAVRSGVRSMATGAKAFVTLAVVGAAVALVAAVIVADDPTERVLLVVAAPVYLVNLGISAAVLFMGGSTSFAGVGSPDHVSLLNFGFPPAANGGTAPPYLFLLLLLGPILISRVTKSRLDDAELTTDSAIITTCFQVALGFALTAWIMAGIAQFSIGGGAHDLRRGFASIDVEPSVSAALGLGLLWGLMGSFGAGIRWGRKRGLLQGLSSFVPNDSSQLTIAGPGPHTDVLVETETADPIDATTQDPEPSGSDS